MKKLILLVLLPILMSCTEKEEVETINQIHLKKYQQFMMQYGGRVCVFTVKEFNKNGVFVTEKDWLWNATVFITFDEIKSDKSYKELNVKDTRGENPLRHLNKGDMFRMKFGGSVSTIIVKEVAENGLLITTTDWLYSSTMDIPFEKYSPDYYKYLGKYKGTT